MSNTDGTTPRETTTTNEALGVNLDAHPADADVASLLAQSYGNPTAT